MQDAHVTHLSRKEPIVIPKGIRHSHQWVNGQAFTVEETSEGILLHSVKQRVFSRTTGCARKSGWIKQ